MSEQLYQIDESVDDRIEEYWGWEQLEERGVLVPVVRCEHGNIDPHIPGHPDITDECPGSPTLNNKGDE